MRIPIKPIGFYIVLLTALGAADAQTTFNVTTTGDTAGQVPVMTGNSTIADSPITVSSGNVGIGTTSPIGPLDVVTSASGGGSSTVNIRQINNSSGNYYANLGFYNSTAGSALPLGNMSLLGAGYPAGNLFQANDFVMLGGQGNAGTNMIFLTNTYGALKFGTGGYAVSNERMRIGANGGLSVGNSYVGTDPGAGNVIVQNNVGIGTTTPSTALEVNGSIKLDGSANGITFPDGTTQSTAFIPANCGADYAEAVDVTGDRTRYEPGDVLVIDPKAPDKFLKSNQPYSTMVSGIYSTKPGFVGRLQPPDPATSAVEVPMAMVGRVPTKVSAENGPIRVGDLLVTSSTMGYAMKGTDRSQMLGAIVGKAMESMDSGTGVIMVLVTLQ